MAKQLFITEFGANTAYENNAPYIQAAIDAAAPEDEVIIPAGTWKTGIIHLKSYLKLRFEDGVTILGSDNYRHYMDGDEWDWNSALFRGENIEHLSVSGPAILDGQNCFCPLGEEGFRGPHMLRLMHCHHMSFRDFTVRDGANYGLLFTDCTDCVVDNVTVIAGHDGVHTMRCRDYQILNCTFRTGDDSIAGNDTENFVIRNCYFNTACNGLRFGGRNVLVENCRFQGPGEFMHRLEGRKASLSAFINFSPSDRNTVIPTENWTVRNITADHMLSLYYLDRNREWQDGPTTRDILFEDITCTNMQESIMVLGRGNCDTNLTFRRCHLHLDPEVPAQPVILMDCFDALTLEDVTLDNQGRFEELVLKNGSCLRLSGSSAQQPYAADNVTVLP